MNLYDILYKMRVLTRCYGPFEEIKLNKTLSISETSYPTTELQE